MFLLVLLVPLTITTMPFKCRGSRLRKLLRLNILGVYAKSVMNTSNGLPLKYVLPSKE